MVVHCRAIPVGTSATAITSFANAFEPSSCAAFWFGPNTAMPCSRRASATPLTRGASGPITTSSALSSRAILVTASRSFTSTARVSTSLAMPSFPGAQTMSVAGVPVRMRALTIACSLAPEPTTRILIEASLPPGIIAL